MFSHALQIWKLFLLESGAIFLPLALAWNSTKSGALPRLARQFSRPTSLHPQASIKHGMTAVVHAVQLHVGLVRSLAHGLKRDNHRMPLI